MAWEWSIIIRFRNKEVNKHLYIGEIIAIQRIERKALRAAQSAV